MAREYVFFFEEGRADQKDLLGGKGANLAEMTRIGLPVPPGFIVSTAACLEYYQHGEALSEKMKEEIRQGISHLEAKLGKRFGDEKNPLLVSVRSGAAASMPGMMDTILNLGLNDAAREGLVEQTGDRRFANDCYRRFIQMFGEVVMGVYPQAFDHLMEGLKEQMGVRDDTDLTANDMEKLVDEFKKIYTAETGETFPQDASEQLFKAVGAVFASWNTDRAVVYRRVNRIPDDLGTAVNVQAMVFGNMGEDCSTGVAFTRNPATGENSLYGEYLVNAQGEDVVAGTRTPQPISGLQEETPHLYDEFLEAARKLEEHYRDMQDIEFTIERGKLYILQTRSGKRTSAAAVKVAVDMVQEGKLSSSEALKRVDPDQLHQMMHPSIDPQARMEVLARGLPASPGAAVGQVVFSADRAEELGEKGDKVILVRPETTPDDIHGIVQAQGILTSRGGMTSHAAVVARGMGKPCICGAESLRIDVQAREFNIDGTVVREGDLISMDGAEGTVMMGEVPLVSPQISGEFQQILQWADETRRLGVRTNADTPEDAKRAREFGAQGIGLCRTEHMFMAQDRLPLVQRMILAQTEEERREALEHLLPLQEGDFYGILKAMQGLPVTIRLLDPPLHEFLPNLEDLLVSITRLELANNDADQLAEKRQMLSQVKYLHEANPMMGHRGCRLGITFPEVYEMQCQAIFQAVARLVKEGVEVFPEVMIPLVVDPRELSLLRDMAIRVAEEVQQSAGVEFQYLVGTMIELPRACMVADEIAEHADFFSFGTNDLTQTVFGFSRDDAEGKFLQAYLQQKILPENPFAVLDEKGVGALVEEGVTRGRSTAPSLKVGICGEHGGDPRSIDFCHRANLDYVSCSPFRVPVARLAAAHARLKEQD